MKFNVLSEFNRLKRFNQRASDEGTRHERAHGCTVGSCGAASRLLATWRESRDALHLLAVELLVEGLRAAVARPAAIVELDADQPATCPKCGSRTSFTVRKDGLQDHRCLIGGHQFVAQVGSPAEVAHADEG